MSTLQAIADKLNHLRDTVDFNKNLEVFNEANANADLFDVITHRYQLGPCLTETALAEIEARYKIRLPADYRAFLLTIGDGGAGPYYGLFSLTDSLQAAHQKGGPIPDVLAQPFPHTDAYMRPIADEAAIQAFLQTVNDPKHVQGTLPIADFGCGVEVLLVISGVRAGTLWLDDRDSDNGVWPLYRVDGVVDFTGELLFEIEHEDQLSLCSFSTWYEAWLDERIDIHAKYQRGEWQPMWTEARHKSDNGQFSLRFGGTPDD